WSHTAVIHFPAAADRAQDHDGRAWTKQEHSGKGWRSDGHLKPDAAPRIVSMLTKFITAAVAAGTILFGAGDASAKKPGHCPPGNAKKGWCVPGPSFGGGHCPQKWTPKMGPGR